LASDTIESALERVRSRLTDNRSMLSDYTAVQRVRGDLADQVQSAVQSGQGNRARMLGGILREIDAAMEAASPGFRAANADFSRRSRNIEAVAEGNLAAQRGRSEDVVRTFGQRVPENQQPFRAGYADRLIENAQGAPGVNKARFVAPPEELRALAVPGTGPTLERQLGRENTMFQTRARALGGSQTFDNFAEAAATGLTPEVVAHSLMGGIHGVMRGGLAVGKNLMTGNTAAVRAEIGRILRLNGLNATSAEINTILERSNRINVQSHRAATALRRGLTGGSLGLLDNMRAR
jgi:hypothetical protein